MLIELSIFAFKMTQKSTDATTTLSFILRKKKPVSYKLSSCINIQYVQYTGYMVVCG